MSEHQAKKRRKTQKAIQTAGQEEKKTKRDFKSAMKELWNLEDNKFLVICIAGLVIILFSTSLPGRIGLLVQTAMAIVFVIGCILKPLIGKEEKAEEEENTNENT